MIEKKSNQTSNALLLETAQASRRKFIAQAGVATFSGVAVAMLGGCSASSALAASYDTVQQDIRILNTAIGAEHEAVAAYQLGAESGLLEPGVLKVAVQF